MAKSQNKKRPAQRETALTVLLAEDANDQAQLLMAILERAGFAVTRVKNGIEAYEAIGRACPDLFITDIMMPGMSGFELLAKLNDERRMVPTIVLTAKQSEEDVLRGLGYGALDYISKPFSPSEVIARVKIALQKKK